MKKLLVVLLMFTAVALIYFVVADYNYTPQIDEQEHNTKDAPIYDEKELVLSPVEEEIKYMTLDEKIGQLFIAGMDGTTLTEHERDKFERYALGGVILFKDNLETPKQSIQLINDLKGLETINDIPLFISVDQEGGRVTRLPGLDPLMSAEEVGNTKDPGFAFKNGQLIGRHLRKFGFQVNFAPVLDINSNPENTVIGDRAFGDHPDIVSEMGIKTMEGLQDQNVITAVKHFPGHGDTTEDSHVTLPIVEKTREELEQNELIPFKRAIEVGVDMVLVAHILLPEIDPDVPATMSKEVIDILRKDMMYDGVTITDDLTMGAITENYPIDEAVVKSFQAGVDIMLIAHGEENITLGISGLKKALENGEINESDIDESVTRILELKQKYALNHHPVKNVSIDEMNEEIKDVYGK